MSEQTNVAIACQGGGSHTAFTAGVLAEAFENWDDDHELVGISGTSGGAFNALAAWYGLVTGDEAKAADIVTDIWADIAVDGPTDRATNSWLTTLSRFEGAGLPLARVSPYQNPWSKMGKERIRSILERHVDFDEIPGYCERTAPELVVGTVNINAGVFETFTNENVTVEAVLASAAVPTLFEAVKINGHYHWDGLFSQNPPIYDLMHQSPERKPDELWVVQINPQELDGEPTSLDEINNRRNELSGNISLNQELRFIERVNEWVESGTLPSDQFRTTDIHRIQMAQGYGASTKLDRDPEFIEELLTAGRERAGQFLAERADS
jgi:NTE family protein